MKRFTLLTTYLLISLSLKITAQVEKAEIVTDRPDQSNTPLLIPKGSLQIETGFLYEEVTSEEIDQANIAFNNTLIKYGVNEYFELRFSAGFLGTRQYVSDGVTTNGFSPMGLGVKIKLADESGFWPQAALVSHIYLKTGSEEYTPQYTPTDICFSFSHTLSDRISLGYNVGGLWGGETPEATFFYTLSLGFSVSGKLGIFAESYAYFPEMHEASHRVDGGVTFKITPVVQFDMSGGIGLSNNAPDYFLSTGLSVRLLK